MARGTARARDRFDEVPVDLARVGAHRAPVRRGRGFVAFAWAALATGALVGAGVFGLSAIERDVAASDPTTTSSAAAAQPAATIDPKASVVVWNGTKTNGLAAGAAKTAKAAGWTVSSTGTTEEQNVKLSTVYYGTKSQLGAALGLAKGLGIGRTQLSTRFDVAGQARLTVVLGSDFRAAS